MLKTSSPLICYFFLSYRHVNHDPVPQWLFLRVILDRDLCATCLESRKWLLIAAMDFTYIPWLLHTFLLWCGTRDSDNLVPYFGPLFGVGAIAIDDDGVVTTKILNLRLSFVLSKIILSILDCNVKPSGLP